MIKLPSGVNINNLIDDIRIFSWQAADILLYYSKLLENGDYKSNILKNNNEDDPVTLADLKVNELIIKGINEKYKNINWDILSEECYAQQKSLEILVSSEPDELPGRSRSDADLTVPI